MWHRHGSTSISPCQIGTGRNTCWKDIQFNIEQILLARSSPFATDVVCEIDWRSDGQNSSIPVVEQRKEHPSEEQLGGSKIATDERIDNVAQCHALGVELGGSPFDVCSEGARSSGYHSPPLIGCVTVLEGDEVPVNDVIGRLSRLG